MDALALEIGEERTVDNVISTATEMEISTTSAQLALVLDLITLETLARLAPDPMPLAVKERPDSTLADVLATNIGEQILTETALCVNKAKPAMLFAIIEELLTLKLALDALATELAPTANLTVPTELANAIANSLGPRMVLEIAGLAPFLKASASEDGLTELPVTRASALLDGLDPNAMFAPNPLVLAMEREL